MEKEYHFTVSKTARFYATGKLGRSTKHIWFLLHGYAQSAKRFLRAFDALREEHTHLIAPEGLHRFYTKGTSGHVGASWMTKEDRLNDIKDYIAYLNQLFDYFHAKAPQCKIHVLGFSQGAATVSRWIKDGQVQVDSLVLYSGLFPPDMAFEVDRSILTKLKVVLTCGREDEYIEAVKLDEQSQSLTQHHIPHEVLWFEGGHEIKAETLQMLKEKIY